jgi:phage tail sheath gpL-like
MSIDASAVARVTGIETKFQDLRGGQILYLPQRIALIAQGSSAASYSSTKFSALSAGDVGNKAGFGSPAHLAMLELKPVNGDGVESIPVDVFLLQQLAGSTAATGDITPTGTQTKAASYRVNIGGVRSAPFVIPVGASVSHIVGAIFAAMQAVLEMPVTATPAYGTVTAANTSGNVGNGAASALAVASGATPRPGAYKLTAVSSTSFKMTDPDGLLVSSAVPVSGAAQTVGGVEFTLTAGATPFAAGDSVVITVAATKLNLTSKWNGESANSLKIVLEGDLYGVTFSFTQPTGGAGNPSISGALAQFGDVWYSLVLNALNSADATALDALASHGEGRWGDLVHKPYVSFLGTHRADAVDCIAVTGTRRTDRVNSLIPNPGSNDLPFLSAARALARVAKLANNNPACDYGGQKLTGRTPGPDASQWDYATRDLAVKNGCSTVEVKDGVLTLSDVVTMYRPAGEEPPAYRYVCDIVKLQQVIFNLALIFEGEGWNGAPLIPDDQPVANSAARKPKDAIAAANAMIDSLGLAAIIADPKSAKKKTRAQINSQNPKRLDLFVTVQLSGNTNVKSITLGFGFYFGTPALAA